ncbi:hypothetical protein BsWGS_20271 [Bradybaena similaris]
MSPPPHQGRTCDTVSFPRIGPAIVSSCREGPASLLPLGRTCNSLLLHGRTCNTLPPGKDLQVSSPREGPAILFPKARTCNTVSSPREGPEKVSFLWEKSASLLPWDRISLRCTTPGNQRGSQFSFFDSSTEVISLGGSAVKLPWPDVMDSCHFMSCTKQCHYLMLFVLFASILILTG